MIISIITPTYNCGHWLNSCIESVASNWVPGVEHIIVDGGSTDDSVKTLEVLAAKYPHIRYVSEKDKGQSDAMNKGLEMAKGKWVGFLNADDYYENGVFERVIPKIESNPENCAVLVGTLVIINEMNQLVKINKPHEMTLARMFADTCEWPFNPAAYFYPKNLHEKIGYFPVDEHFAMDYDFLLKCWVKGIPFEYYDEVWGIFRLLPEAKTSKDQQMKTSYQRSQELREFYFKQLSWNQQWQVRLEKIRWFLVLKWRRLFP